MSVRDSFEMQPVEHIDLWSAVRKLPEILAQIEILQSGARLLLVVDGIRTTDRLAGIRSLTARNASRVNENVFGYIYNVIWLVKYVNNLFKSVWGCDDLLYINSHFGDRVDVTSVSGVNSSLAAAALVIVSMMLKTKQGDGANVRAVVALEGTDWVLREIDWGEALSGKSDVNINQLQFTPGLIQNIKSEAGLRNINERRGILLSPNLQEVEVALQDVRYLDEQCNPLGDFWNREVLETTADQIPKIDLVSPEIITTCTLVISGKEASSVAGKVITNLVTKAGLEVLGGPDSEKDDWQWFSIRMSNGKNIEQLRKLVFDICTQVNSEDQCLIGITVDTGMWVDIADQRLVMHPYAAAIFSRIMYELKYDGYKGIYSIGNFPPIMYKPEMIDLEQWSGELVARMTNVPNTRYLETEEQDVDTGVNTATYFITQPDVCLPGSGLEQVVDLFGKALHADNHISTSTYYLAELQVRDADKKFLTDTSSVLMREWLENLPKYYQWAVACIGIVGDMADTEFLTLVNALLKDRKNADIHVDSFQQLVSEAPAFSEPSSMLYSFATTINSWALDLMQVNEFRLFFRDLFHFLITDQGPEQIAHFSYIKQIVPLMDFYAEAAKKVPGVAELIPVDEMMKGALGVCLYLHNEGLNFRHVLEMCDYEVLKSYGPERELYLLLSLAAAQENRGYLAENYSEYRDLLLSSDFPTLLSTDLGQRLRMMVIGKERPYYENYGKWRLNEIDFSELPSSNVINAIREARELARLQLGGELDITDLGPRFIHAIEGLNNYLSLYLMHIHNDSCFKLLRELVRLRGKLLYMCHKSGLLPVDDYANLFMKGAYADACYVMHLVASLRSFPGIFFETEDEAVQASICDADIKPAGLMLQQISDLLRQVDVYRDIAGAGDIDANKVTELLEEAQGILRVRYANLLITRASLSPESNIDAEVVDETIRSLNEMLDREPINFIVASRSLINLLALVGKFKKSAVSLDEMQMYTGNALGNAIRTGMDIFPTAVNIYAAFAEERSSVHLQHKLENLFSDRKVLNAYQKLTVSLPQWLRDQLDHKEIPFIFIKNYTEAILGVMLRFGIQNDFRADFEKLLECVFAELEILSPETKLHLHADAVEAAMGYEIFQKEPSLIEVIGSDVVEG